MTAATVATRREAVLAHLGEHPDLTSWELARAIDTSCGSLTKLLEHMEQRAQVVAAPSRRPGRGAPVKVWRVAPPGTVPPPPSPESTAKAEQRRARERAWRRARRAQQREALTPRVPDLPPGAACAGADPDLFFPGPGGGANAEAICARCPVRAACLARAEALRVTAGIWGGVNFETERPRTTLPRPLPRPAAEPSSTHRGPGAQLPADHERHHL